MDKDTFTQLTLKDRRALWSFISDNDIAVGSDGKDYIYTKALKWYFRAKYELDNHITEVERGTYPEHGR